MTKSKTFWVVTLVMCLLAFTVVVARASGGQVIHVPRDYSTIQAAVDAAAAGDTVQVKAGVYNEKVVVSTSSVRLHATSGVVLDGTGLTGVGILVRGTSIASPVSDVEVSGFEVRNFERGIIVQWAVNASVHHNEVHQNVDKIPPLVLGDAAGIELITTHLSEVSQNFVHDNGDGGIQLRVGSTQNTIRANRVHGNGTQRTTGMGAAGILLTGLGTNDNSVLENVVIGNYGRGIMLTRPMGTAPITGNLVAQNRAHDNQRSGIAIMSAAIDNFVLQNDARWNNISGLPPCYRCNLFDMSIGTNVWERNLGTFNLTDACAP
ncbi:MAG: right-handed parallel beta-helix repeat-containing protein [Acidobacteria bacterium]|nr:right-handed parallel beta-helix repeat-containing protein [Acidobacteriota bacterium]